MVSQLSKDFKSYYLLLFNDILLLTALDSPNTTAFDMEFLANDFQSEKIKFRYSKDKR